MVSPERLRLFWPGLVAGLLLLPAFYLPYTITHIGEIMAASDHPDDAERGVRWLRAVGDRDALLGSCYRRSDSPLDLLTGLIIGSQTVTTDEARKIYYRVTGTPFNAVSPPQLQAGLDRWTGADRFDFTPEAHGTILPGRIDGLSLAQSRLDGTIDADDALAYLEWTMVFENHSPRQEEATAAIALPPGGWCRGSPSGSTENRGKRPSAREARPRRLMIRSSRKNGTPCWLLPEGSAANRETALNRAVVYQLVTPVSGAVVLETEQQYRDAELTPVPPGTVPSVPEPEIWMLIAILVLLAGIARYTYRRRVRP